MLTGFAQRRQGLTIFLPFLMSSQFQNEQNRTMPKDSTNKSGICFESVSKQKQTIRGNFNKLVLTVNTDFKKHELTQLTGCRVDDRIAVLMC
jgi:hypothetical protein